MPYKKSTTNACKNVRRASANKLRSFRIGFKAVMAAVYSRNTDLKLFGVEPRVKALRMALEEFMSILFEESDTLQVDTILEGLINSAKSLAIFFSLDNIACCSLLKQLCYACVERTYAKKATGQNFRAAFSLPCTTPHTSSTTTLTFEIAENVCARLYYWVFWEIAWDLLEI